jgi:hypothetical protein
MLSCLDSGMAARFECHGTSGPGCSQRQKSPGQMAREYLGTFGQKLRLRAVKGSRLISISEFISLYS